MRLTSTAKDKEPIGISGERCQRSVEGLHEVVSGAVFGCRCAYSASAHCTGLASSRCSAGPGSSSTRKPRRPPLMYDPGQAADGLLEIHRHRLARGKWRCAAHQVPAVAIRHLGLAGFDRLGADLARQVLRAHRTVAMHQHQQRLRRFVLHHERLDDGIRIHRQFSRAVLGPTEFYIVVDMLEKCHAVSTQPACCGCLGDMLAACHDAAPSAVAGSGGGAFDRHLAAEGPVQHLAAIRNPVIELTARHGLPPYHALMYQVKRASRSEFIPMRNARLPRARIWGEPSADVAPLVLVHGWMDVAASYQFVVDALSEAFVQGRLIIAPDWRGYGLTSSPRRRQLLVSRTTWPTWTCCSTTMRRDRAGRPGRPQHGRQRRDAVRRRAARSACAGWSTWKASAGRRSAPDAGARALRPVDRRAQAHCTAASWRCAPTTASAGVARRLIEDQPAPGPRPAGQDKADWLAGHWARENAEGSWEILGDPAHKIVNAQLFRVDEVLALYAPSACRCWPWRRRRQHLGDVWWKGRSRLEEYHERLQVRCPTAASRVVAGRRPHAAPRPARAAGRAARGLLALTALQQSIEGLAREKMRGFHRTTTRRTHPWTQNTSTRSAPTLAT